MEKEANIIYICDNYSNIVYGQLKTTISERYTREKGYQLNFKRLRVENGIDGAITIVNSICQIEPEVIIVNLGFYEMQREVEVDRFNKQYKKLIERLSAHEQRRIIVCTLPKCKRYSDIIEKIALEYQIRIANVYTYWKGEKILKPKLTNKGFNKNAIEVTIKAITPVLIRTKMLVLWQYNGRYAHCNYSCPYCYVATSVNKGMHIVYDLDKWEKAFSRHFENTDTVFYFSYGEPTMGGNHFYEALEMIARHPNWSVRMTSNVSVPLDRLLNTTLAKEGRLNVNASFHPTQISVEKFIEKCDQLRSGGIDPSVIYVMYPDQIDDLDSKFMPLFRKKGYRVHIRAFRGLYKGKKYPQAYTKEQWVKTAKYMDEANFKYQLTAVNGLGRMSMLGMTHILVDNYGKIEMCDSYVGDRRYGNIFDDKIHLDLQPYPFPGLVPLAAVDDIADYVELDYDDLEKNNVNDYNTQGKVYVKDDGTINYPYENENLYDKKRVKELLKVPKPFKAKWKYWTNPLWIAQHFIYSYVIKKYGKYIWAWIRGKWSLFKQGKLSRKNFWHS